MGDDQYNPRQVARARRVKRGENEIPRSPKSTSSSKSDDDVELKGCSHFKEAQWSPDGTSILASSANNTLSTFIIPPDILSYASPQILDAYSVHQAPEPVYATAFHPSYSIQEPASALYAVSLRSLPIRLISPFSPSIIASYPLISPTTEEYIAPHSLLFSSHNPNTFFTGSLNLISVFDINRNGEGPLERMPTIPNKRSKVVGGVGGIKGIVSALEISTEGILAAGTFSRWVGLYDGYGRGGSLGAFEVGNDMPDQEEEGGTGITQVLWSGDGRYLAVVERCSGGISVWDIRGTGKRLAWLRGRNANTNQRLGVEVFGGEVWAGGVDGKVRVWEEIGLREGIVDPKWEFQAHDDAVSSTTWHFSGSVLATCSGQRHFIESESDGMESLPLQLPSFALENDVGIYQADNSLKIWSF